MRHGEKDIMKLVVLRKKFFVTIAVAVFAAIAVCCVVPATVQAFGKNGRKLPIYRVETEEKKIAISFDCAWGVDYTDKLLSIMKENDVVCTFFTVEFWTKKYPEYVKKIDEAGHDIGTHSATHPYMSKLNKETIIKELETSSAAITAITGKKVEVFRPPYGDYNNLLIETAYEKGLYPIQWDVDSLDWKNISAKEIESRVLGKIRNGSIVLFHNNGLHTAEALPAIIKGAKEKGYEFVKISDLIYRENFSMAADGSQIKNN